MEYLSGFGNYFKSSLYPDVILPAHNSPQKIPYGLYAEQISGSAFTSPRHQKLYSWVYRIYPSVTHSDFVRLEESLLKTAPISGVIPPNQLRWSPLPTPTQSCDFIQSLTTLAVNGNAALNMGGAMHLFACNKSMTDYFYNADGEWLIIPYEGEMRLKTEMGVLEIKPQEIAVIPRGIKFQVECLDELVCGYVAENYGQPLRLPELGPLGANALANPRDFLYPMVCVEDKPGEFRLVAKFNGALWEATMDHSPLDVVAWHGNYAPYKYDLRLFNTINTVSFDHPDPSIFTVLTSASAIPGTANLDFVIFPERWMVATNTFRPPYYHRNIMSELMGLIMGHYDAKPDGFLPGGSSLHNCFSAHGPDTQAYEKAVSTTLKPEYYEGTLAFMLESCYPWHPTTYALESDIRQTDYMDCWRALKRNFNNPR